MPYQTEYQGERGGEHVHIFTFTFQVCTGNVQDAVSGCTDQQLRCSVPACKAGAHRCWHAVTVPAHWLPVGRSVRICRGAWYVLKLSVTGHPGVIDAVNDGSADLRLIRYNSLWIGIMIIEFTFKASQGFRRDHRNATTGGACRPQAQCLQYCQVMRCNGHHASR
jgi:hypothetical protein